YVFRKKTQPHDQPERQQRCNNCRCVHRLNCPRLFPIEDVVFRAAILTRNSHAEHPTQRIGYRSQKTFYEFVNFK
ncbi:MAG: hypothetical protein OEM61_07655, partial [Desulfobacteraceae bacterium]|nr:hypothetical protein [Desulfobacteraceae bacterium]